MQPLILFFHTVFSNNAVLASAERERGVRACERCQTHEMPARSAHPLPVRGDRPPVIAACAPILIRTQRPRRNPLRLALRAP